MELVSKSGRKLEATAKSVGGGMIALTELNGWPVLLDGKSHEVMVLASASRAREIKRIVASDGQLSGKPVRATKVGSVFLSFKRKTSMAAESWTALKRLKDIDEIRVAPPIFYAQQGAALFLSGTEMVLKARRRHRSLGELTLTYEARLLGLSEQDIVGEVLERYEIMRDSVSQGLAGHKLGMRLLKPSAGQVFRSEASGSLPIGGVHARAAARALAALHVSNSGGIVCAAPTGGSAGVLPGVIVTLGEEKRLDKEKTALALLAASAVGLIIARRATFAAEVAGCQVEIGAAGAMAAAAVVEACGGNPGQAADAAAISLQNTMGSVCDLVQGMCEIPCHTRNAVAASNAFVCADLVLGGYRNPIPLDETIDAAYASGRMLPPELRCTARGGIAMAPSARALKHL